MAKNPGLRNWTYPTEPEFRALLGKHGDDLVSSTECRRRLQNVSGKPMAGGTFTNKRYEYPETFPKQVWPNESAAPNYHSRPFWYLWSEIKEWWRAYLNGEITEVRHIHTKGTGWAPNPTGGPPQQMRRALPAIFAKEGDFEQYEKATTLWDETEEAPVKGGAFSGKHFPVDDNDGIDLGVDLAIDFDKATELLNLTPEELGKFLREHLLMQMGPYTVTVTRNGHKIAEYDNLDEDNLVTALFTAAMRADE